MWYIHSSRDTGLYSWFLQLPILLEQNFLVRALVLVLFDIFMKTITCNSEKSQCETFSSNSEFPATYLTVIHIYFKEYHVGILFREGLENLKWKIHKDLEPSNGNQYTQPS